MHHSDGCANCKRRRIRCDEKWPQCLRCTKANLDCPGKSHRPEPAQGELSFRDQTRSTETRVVRRQQQQQQTLDRSRSRSNTPSQESSNSRVGDSAHLITRASFAQLWGNFLSEYLPQTHSNAFSTNYGFLTHLATVPRTQAAFDNALKALPLVQLGTTKSDDRLIRASREAYVTSIEQLRRLLQYPTAARQDETLATMLVLGLCERYTGVYTAPDGWFSHTRGARHYLTSRGPGSVTSKAALALFNTARASSIAVIDAAYHGVSLAAEAPQIREGILTHRHVNFDTHEWLAVTAELSQTDIWSALVDIAVHLPCVLERVNSIVHAHDVVESSQSPPQMPPSTAQIQHEIDTSNAAFEAWHTRVQSYGHSCGLTSISDLLPTSSATTPHPPFSHAYTARIFNNVLNHFLHASYRLILARAELQLYYHSPFLDIENEPRTDAYSFEGAYDTGSPREISLLRRYAHTTMEVLRHIPHMLQPSNGTASCIMLTSVLWVLQAATGECGLREEGEWVQALLGALERRGMSRVGARGLGELSPLRPGEMGELGSQEEGGYEGKGKGRAP